MALNRHGGPRITYLPANKSLGKLSTYVKSVILFVDDSRTEVVISRLFGANHVKHGIKHLCDSGKELNPLNPSKMIHPDCSVSQKITAKKQMNTNWKGSNGKRLPPAALTNRPHHQNQRQQYSKLNSNVCTSPNQCPKKKKKNSGQNAKGNNSEEDSMPQLNQNKLKPNKNIKRVNRNPHKQPEMSSASKRADTLFQYTSAKRWTPLDSTINNGAIDDDALNDMSESMQVVSNGQSAFADDDDEYNEEND